MALVFTTKVYGNMKYWLALIGMMLLSSSPAFADEEWECPYGTHLDVTACVPDPPPPPPPPLPPPGEAQSCPPYTTYSPQWGSCWPVPDPAPTRNPTPPAGGSAFRDPLLWCDDMGACFGTEQQCNEFKQRMREGGVCHKQ